MHRVQDHAQTRHQQLSDDEWFDLVCTSMSKDALTHRGEPLPGFPSDEYRRRTNGSAGIEPLKQAFDFYVDCKSFFRDVGAPLTDDSTILDFGAGWGRITRFFLKSTPLKNIYGIDAQSESVETCRKTFRSDNFYKCDPLPPSPLEASSFSHIVGFSVFSHLSEEACRTWIEEFYRLLAPGGALVLSTRGLPFLKYCQSLSEKSDLPSYSRALGQLFGDFEAARQQFIDGHFLHSNIDGVNGGEELNASFYGETFIPEAYAAREYGDYFELSRYDATGTHPIMYFVRR